METLGNTVRSLRKQYRLTQRQLADKAGVGYRFISDLENDKPTLNMDKVNHVLYMFGKKLGPSDITHR